MSLLLTRRSMLRATASASITGLFSTALQAEQISLTIGAVLPFGGGTSKNNAENLSDLAASAKRGLTFGLEDTQKNADLFGDQIKIHFAAAPSSEAAVRSAKRLVQLNKVQVLIGGFGLSETEELMRIAEENGVLFLNIACSADRLRQQCNKMSFHIEPSAAMYLDAIAAWYLRAGYRKWFIISDDTLEGTDRSDRSLVSIQERHWGGKVVGQSNIQKGQTNFENEIHKIAKTKPDVVINLSDWLSQLRFAARFEAESSGIELTGFPEQAAQLRAFYGSLGQICRNSNAGHRASSWECTLDAYGARELNARFAARWGAPMDPISWAGFQAIKLSYEAAKFSNSSTGLTMSNYLSDPSTLLDVHKGIGVSFRLWDNQLRQSLYLVRLSDKIDNRQELEAIKARAQLVGEMPAIYMPGTDPVERLDQIGDLSNLGDCKK